MDLSGLETILVSLHAMGAALLQTPELALDDAEGKLLADAIGKVNRHYNKSILSAKHIDWINLISATGAIYGPRMMMIKMRHASDAAKDVTPPPAQPAATQPGVMTAEEYAKQQVR